MHKVLPKDDFNLYEEIITIIKEKKLPSLKRNFIKGQTIFMDNDYCSRIGIILKGTVMIEQILSNGNKNLIKELNQFDVFGEILIFSNHPYYPYHILAKTKCEILFISKDILLKIFKEDNQLLEKFLVYIAQSHMNLNQFIKLTTQKTILRKLAYYFLHYAHITEENNAIKIDTKTQLAQFIGVERQSLIRELNHLKDKNLLDYNRKYIYIKDYLYFKELIE